MNGTNSAEQLVPVEEQKVIDFGRFPIHESAWGFYNEPRFQKGQCGNAKGLTIRQFLPMKWAGMLAKVLGRQLTVEDLNALVHGTTELVVCIACEKLGKEDHLFQTVEFTNVPWMLKELPGMTEIPTDEKFRLGCYLAIGAKMVSLCGAPFWYNQQATGPDGYEVMGQNKFSHLGEAYLSALNRNDDGRPRPMRTKASATAVTQKIGSSIEYQNSRRIAAQEERDRSSSAVLAVLGDAQKATQDMEWRPGQGLNVPGGKRNGLNGGARDNRRRR